MKKIAGVNPDFADFDELDSDALDAVEEFQEGTITFEELRNLVGADAATSIKEQMECMEEFDPERWFDDPEDL